MTTMAGTGTTAGRRGAEMLESINPATGAVVGAVAVTETEEIPALVTRARAAGESWGSLDLGARADHLRPLGAKLAERAGELGALITGEMGKPRKDAVGEVEHCGTSLEATLDEIAAALAPEELADETARSVVYHDPFGVCAAITPWNFPLAMPHWLVVPALAAGNTVILKPSEETPLIAQAYAELLMESLPPGVLQVVHGADAQGAALVAADVDLVVFTGSREVGKKILAAAGPGLTRVILELGGKDPLLVLDDADVEAAAAFAAHNSFRNSGQVCVSTERIYVDEKIADAFTAEVVKRAGACVVGEGTREDVTIGPMINARQRDHVLEQIDRAVAQGARIAAGGAGHHDNFITPTVLTGLTHEMDVMREETFGPVACIMPVAGAEEAVRLANDTPFGLGAAVFGRDERRAAAVARRLTAGMVGINKGCGGASGCPWVGAQQSGFGYHSGREGHRQFTQARVVSRAAGPGG